MSGMEAQARLIRLLKQERIRQGLSYQKLVDLSVEEGCGLSMSTIRKIFGPDSEELHYRMQDTLLPLAGLLLGIRDADQLWDHVAALPSEKGEDAGEEDTAGEKSAAPEEILRERVDVDERLLEERYRFILELQRQLGREREQHRQELARLQRIAGTLAAVLALCVLLLTGLLAGVLCCAYDADLLREESGLTLPITQERELLTAVCPLREGEVGEKCDEFLQKTEKGFAFPPLL